MNAARQAFVVVSGNTGVGKSTLLARIASRDGLAEAVIDESELHHPQMTRMFEAPAEWALPVQLHFVARRAARVRAALEAGRPLVMERSLDEDTLFFRHYVERGAIQPEIQAPYAQLVTVLGRGLPRPDLLVHLRAPGPFLVERLTESKGEVVRPPTDRLPEYVEAINRLYAEWAERAPELCGEYLEVDVAGATFDVGEVAEKVVAFVRAGGRENTSGT